MTLRRDFRRVTKAQPCQICGKPDWCLASTDGSSAICARIESSSRAGEAGWLHRMRDCKTPRGCRAVRSIRLGGSSHGIGSDALRALADQYSASVPPESLTRLATTLGLSAESLLRLHIGWTGRAWSFPMTDCQGEVRGIRLRLPDGSKCAVKGGHEGLFIPSGLGFESPLLIAEGPSDCAALLDLGFDAIGRPNCRGGRLLIIDFIKRHRTPEVVIVADGDVPGQQGAASLGRSLVCRVHRVRVITPPPSIKDVRAWKLAGATKRDVQRTIDDADSLRLRVDVRRVGR